MSALKLTELIIFALFFVGATAVGMVASRWRSPSTMNTLDEWGLGGRRYGPLVTWFMLGGGIYTGYAFIAAPAAAFAEGASGFFVLPYLIIAFPLMFMPLTRLWSVSRVRGYVTSADYVRGRYGSRTLTLFVAITGIVATIPYIALQLIALEAVLRTMGLNRGGLPGHLPLLIAFVIFALVTNRSGLRAPTLLAFGKAILIYLVVFVAVLYLPIKMGGWASIFSAADAKFDSGGLLLDSGEQLHYATLALGSALALFLYPHAVTGVLACRRRDVIKRNMCALPSYTMLLGVLVLLGYAAIATGVRPLTNNATGQPDNNTVIPLLFDVQFPDWFAGLAFSAIAIAALVPAAIMAIGAANLWARSIYRHYLRRDATPAQETKQARIASLAVKFGALALVVGTGPQFSYDLQLLGGVIILQTLPAVVISLYSRWFHVYGLIVGWFAGITYATYLLAAVVNPATGRRFAGTSYPLGKIELLGWQPFAGNTATIYVGFVALVVNLAVAALITVLLKAMRVRNGRDDTRPVDYYADEYDPSHQPVGITRC